MPHPHGFPIRAELDQLFAKLDNNELQELFRDLLDVVYDGGDEVFTDLLVGWREMLAAIEASPLADDAVAVAEGVIEAS